MPNILSGPTLTHGEAFELYQLAREIMHELQMLDPKRTAIRLETLSKDRQAAYHLARGVMIALGRTVNKEIR